MRLPICLNFVVAVISILSMFLHFPVIFIVVAVIVVVLVVIAVAFDLVVVVTWR